MAELDNKQVVTNRVLSFELRNINTRNEVMRNHYSPFTKEYSHNKISISIIRIKIFSLHKIYFYFTQKQWKMPSKYYKVFKQNYRYLFYY